MGDGKVEEEACGVSIATVATTAHPSDVVGALEAETPGEVTTASGAPNFVVAAGKTPTSRVAVAAGLTTGAMTGAALRVTPTAGLTTVEGAVGFLTAAVTGSITGAIAFVGTPPRQDLTEEATMDPTGAPAEPLCEGLLQTQTATPRQTKRTQSRPETALTKRTQPRPKTAQTKRTRRRLETPGTALRRILMHPKAGRRRKAIGGRLLREGALLIAGENHGRATLPAATGRGLPRPHPCIRHGSLRWIRARSEPQPRPRVKSRCLS